MLRLISKLSNISLIYRSVLQKNEKHVKNSRENLDVLEKSIIFAPSNDIIQGNYVI